LADYWIFKERMKYIIESASSNMPITCSFVECEVDCVSFFRFLNIEKGTWLLTS